MERIVEIAEEGRHLCRERGFLVVKAAGKELGRIPLDDIGVVIASAHGLTFSNNLLLALAERNAPVVLCGTGYSPMALMWPVVGHQGQSGRIEAQAGAGKPLKKRLWQQVVRAKIENQAALLDMLGLDGAPVRKFANKVKSGDPENMEGAAAGRYWKLLFGGTFRRERNGPPPNNQLNYGYQAVEKRTIAVLLQKSQTLA